MTVELTIGRGPNWIHAWTDSEEAHPIYKLASDTDTPVHHWNNNQLIYDSEGNQLPDDVTDRLSTLLWNIIEDAFKFSEEAHAKNGGKDIPAQDSLHDFIKANVDKYFVDDTEVPILLQMSEMFGAYVGEPIWKQSLRFAWMEECCGGGKSNKFYNDTKTQWANIAKKKRKCLSSQTTPQFSTKPPSPPSRELTSTSTNE